MSWILTYSGVKFDLLDPQPEMILASDIAITLARLARFNGHTSRFYSVAQHSVLVAQRTKGRLAGLLHDASESYIGDMVKPLKRMMPLFDTIELRIQRAIEERFSLPAGSLSDDDVKYWDARLLATERRDLMIDSPHEWSNLPSSIDGLKISPWPEGDARLAFCGLFQSVTGELPDQWDASHRAALATDHAIPCWRD